MTAGRGCEEVCYAPACKLRADQRLAAQVLQMLVRLGRQADSLDWVTICQCLMFLDNPEEVAKILHKLLTGSEVSLSPPRPLTAAV